MAKTIGIIGSVNGNQHRRGASVGPPRNQKWITGQHIRQLIDTSFDIINKNGMSLDSNQILEELNKLTPRHHAKR